MTRAADVLACLQDGRPVSWRTVIVTAHPDDETVSLGGALSLFAHASIVQLTDGAIDDPDAWDRAGALSRAQYRDLRRHERDTAFREGGWTSPVIDCDVIDQQTVDHLPTLIARVTAALADADVVWTHPYEGGHPDHDSAAFIVQQACASLSLPPARLEFASYHWDGSARRAGVFWPHLACPAVRAVIEGARLHAKIRALAAYRSQQSVLRWFAQPWEEWYRRAPRYDFSQPPPTPACWYDRKAWKVTSGQWRAAAALARQAVPA